MGGKMTEPQALSPLTAVHEVFQRYLYLPDPGVVTVTLGAIAANMMDGNPVWLMLVGPPASGKTQTLDSLHGLPSLHHAATLTESSLLSGTPQRDKAADAQGGLLRIIGDFGILVCKDFTSVLSMHHDARAQVLAALREVYDGAWSRHIGSDGGRQLEWKGKVGFLGGVTPIIDELHGVMSQMGERFLIYRMPKTDPELQGFMTLQNRRNSGEKNKSLSDAVKLLFASGFDTSWQEPARAEWAGRVVSLATLVAHSRSAVVRDHRTREIDLVPDSELPSRIINGLSQLNDGMGAIGVDSAERWRLLRKIGFDSIPATRRRLLVLLHGTLDPIETANAAEELGLPTTTARRAFEDLAAHGVAERIKGGPGRADRWLMSKSARERWENMGGTDR
jgi:hypothetical protein